MKKGIDISYYQGDINFDLVKKDGIEFVIIREGYRNTTDSKFFEYVKQAKEAQLPILACYHFSYALDVKEARREADDMVHNMKTAGLGPEVLCFFDLEYDTIIKAAVKGVTLGKRRVNDHAMAFCERIKELGYIPGIYTNMDFYENTYAKDLLSRYHMWMADYSYKPAVKSLFLQCTDKGRVNGINSLVDIDYYYGDEFKMEDKKLRSRHAVVDLVNSWIGKNEADGSYKSIIDLYNSYTGKLPRGIKMDYSWAWCACTWSALAIALGYTDIMPIEISCGYLIERAKEMGCWVETDSYVPKPGDAILYDWQDNGIGDNTGWPDHVGTVVYVNPDSGYMIITEGNCADAVKQRTISINGKFIRGFITPAYDSDSGPRPIPTPSDELDIKTLAHQVIAGMWGNGEERKEWVTLMGYDYSLIQAEVNRILNTPAVPKPVPEITSITTSCYATHKTPYLKGMYEVTEDLHCRNDAGTNKKALCIIPKGTKVRCYGFYSISDLTTWPLVIFKLGNVEYTGFCSVKYLKWVAT